MRPWLPRVIAFTAVAVLVLAPVGGLAAAGILWGDVECCCGPHDAHDDCGCPDCPAVEGDHDDGDRDPSPAFRRCGVDGELVGPAALPRVVLPPAVVIVAPAAVAVPTGPPEPRPPDRTIELETPPPRART